MFINQRNPSRAEHGTGYYLALTFGTLLSSQGADAHDTRPHPWPSFAAVSPRYAPRGGSQVPGPEAPNPPAGRRRPGTSPRPAPGLAGRREKVTWPPRAVSNRSTVTPDTPPQPAGHPDDMRATVPAWHQAGVRARGGSRSPRSGRAGGRSGGPPGGHRA